MSIPKRPRASEELTSASAVSFTNKETALCPFASSTVEMFSDG